MASEITYQFQLQLVNGSLKDFFSVSGQSSDQATARLVRNVQDIGFAAHEALTLGEVATPGYAIFQNLDATNYVEIGIDVTATFYPFLKLEPGEYSGPVRLGMTAPYALADTAAVDLFYIIYET